jgi:NitT/TauT family transport system substrate-binding protein
VKLFRARASVVVSAVLLGAAAAGCSASGGGSTAATSTNMPVVTGLETKHITVFDFPAIDSTGLFIAENQGLFAREGLTVTVVPDFKSSQDTVDSIEKGAGQVAGADWVTVMNDFAGADPNLEIVSEGSVLTPNVLTLMAAPGSKIKSLSDLKNAAIPVSGIHDIANLLIDSLLHDNNINPDTVHYVPNVPLPKVPFMIAAGAFKTGPVPEPFVSMGEQQAGDTVLADMDQGAMSGFPIQGYTVTKEWAQQNPNTLKAFVTALDEGQEIADTNRNAVETAVGGKPLAVPKNVAAVMALPEFPAGVDPTRLQRVMTNMIQFGFFTGKNLAVAKAFQAKNVVYPENLANANGQSDLLAG